MDLQCLNAFFEDYGWNEAVKHEKEESRWRKEVSWRTRERDAFVKVFKNEGTDFDGSGWRRVRQGHAQEERGCGTVLSAIAKKVGDSIVMRVESI